MPDRTMHIYERMCLLPVFLRLSCLVGANQVVTDIVVLRIDVSTGFKPFSYLTAYPAAKVPRCCNASLADNCNPDVPP